MRSTVELGRTLGLSVVAEGVEDADAWRVLAELACDQLQGYYLCRPLPEDAVLDWVRDYVPPSAAVAAPLVGAVDAPATGVPALSAEALGAGLGVLA